jgi:hypothetical protein
LNGQTIAHGGTETAYQTSSVAFGNTCISETRSCSDGNLSGSYAYSSCAVSSASQSSSNYSANGSTFNITVSSSGDYSNKYYVDGVQTGSLNLKKGCTYYFNVDDSSTDSHPLFIGTTSGGGNFVNEYSSGVTNSRATSGLLTFNVPADAPSQLYYNCGYHSSMGGIINIIEADSASTSTSPAIDSNRCTAIKNSITNAGFGSEVTISCDNNHAYLASNTYPSHNLMNGITATNEQTAVPAKDYKSPIALSPSSITSETYTTRDAALGVAVNGVPIYDYSSRGELDISNWSYSSKEDTHALGQLDNCGGHSGRGDDYHYHKKPTCMIDQMTNKDSNPIIGWAFDGYPIYGDNAPVGNPAGALGLCNHTTDETFGYRYHTSSSAPYIIMCLVGVTDSSKLNTVRVSPLPGRTSGRPINVTDLSFQTNASNRTLSYKYGNSDYYIRYTPTGNDCYDFESKTVEDGGVIKTGTYCR